MDGLPTPPSEELSKPLVPKRAHGASKPVKAAHRTLKRTSTHGRPPSPTRDTHSQHGDGKHRRVWKACERCRMKKTKCDGEFPCKRCKDDGLICTAGTRKKTEYKQLPPGYAEVLENTQLVLVATVQKLYSMVRNGEGWALGEPELNDRGQPVVHNVASKLGCLRPNSDVDLPPNATFPEDAAGMAELARQLRENAAVSSASGPTAADPMGSGMDYSRTDRAGSMPTSDAGVSDLDHDADYSTTAFGAASAVSMSPASLTYDFEYASSDGFPPSQHSPAMPQQAGGPNNNATTYSWFNRPSPMHPGHPMNALNIASQQQQQQQQQQSQQMQQINLSAQQQMDMDLGLATDVQAQQMWAAANQAAFMGAVLPGQAALAPYGFSAACRDTKIMMLRGDPLIYTGCDDEDLRSQLANAEA